MSQHTSNFSNFFFYFNIITEINFLFDAWGTVGAVVSGQCKRTGYSEIVLVETRNVSLRCLTLSRALLVWYVRGPNYGLPCCLLFVDNVFIFFTVPKAPSTRIRFRLETQPILCGLAFRPHLSGENGDQKRNFLQSGIFWKLHFLCFQVDGENWTFRN